MKSGERPLSDGKGNKTTYAYDAYGRPYRIYYPDPANVGVSSSTDYEEYGYNVNSQVTSTRRRSGVVVGTPRDALGRITLEDVPATAEDVYFSYDNQGRQLTARFGSPTGTGITQTYDGLGRMETRTVFGRQLSYQYDLRGRRMRLTHPDGFYVTYAHSNTDELVSVTDSTGATVATYGYDALGARASLTRPNAASTSYAPDAARRLQQITHDLSGTGFDLTTTFAYNPAGQITSKTVSNDAAYTWTPPTSTTPAQFDGQNQLTSFAGTAVTDDANGNVWTGLGSLTYTYDALGQLRQASGGASPALVDYDPAGMLRRVQVGSTTTEYLYDGADLVAQYNGSGAVLRRFVHGASHDEPLVVYEGSGTSNKTWLHADERGSIIAASNASGVAATSVKYSADGDSGPLVSPFGYTGQLHLPELQLYYYKARMYSPKAGRFPQPDPIGYAGGMNLFGYVGNDPVNRTDPSGLCWDTQPFQYVNALSVLEDGTRGNPRPTAVRNPEYELYSCEWLYQWQMTGYVDFSQPSSDSTSPSPPPPLPLSCPPAARAEYRYGGFLAVSIRLGRVFMFDVDLDAGSSRRDILSGQRRITTGIKFGGELLGTGGEVEWFHRDIPLQPGDLAPGLLWREPYETVGDWRSPLEMDGSTERGIPLGGAKLGVGVGGLWSFDPLAPLCGNG